jgi:hypothetical protein
MRSIWKASNLAFGLLVGFRSPDNQDESVRVLVDVINIKSDFTAPQCAGEADQYQSSVSYVNEFVVEWCQCSEDQAWKWRKSLS